MKIALLHTQAQIAADQTPQERDRILDVLRAFAILGVVLGHVMMSVVYWDGDRPILGNVLASSVWLQLLTWLLQVMPLFFIAGGAASFLSWNSAVRKKITYSTWLWQRMSRLLNPVLFYLTIMAPIGGITSIFVADQLATPLLNLTTQLLWFLGVYLLITALTPVLSSMHRALNTRSALIWLSIVMAVDYSRLFTSLPGVIGFINFVAVWAIAATCGIWYLDAKFKRSTLLFIVIAGLAANMYLVRFGPYPVSLVGMPNENFSNMAPPSLVMAIQTFVMWALVELIREHLNRISARPRIWKVAVAVNMSAMTIYLWHLPMLIVVTVVAHLTHLSPAAALSAEIGAMPADGYWLAAAVLWLVTWALVFALVQVIWFTEHLRWPFFKVADNIKPALWRTPMAILGVIATGVGMLLLAGSGLAGFPTKVSEFSGLHWSSGFAVLVVLGGTFIVRVSAAAISRAPAQSSSPAE